MARYPYGLYSRRKTRTRMWIYVISALVVIVVVIGLIYGFFGKSGDETGKVTTGEDISGEIKPPVVEQSPLPPEPNLPEITTEPVFEPNSRTAVLIDEAMTLINAKPAKIIEARYMLNDLLPMPMSPGQLAFVKKQLSELADEWLFGRKI